MSGFSLRAVFACTALALFSVPAFAQMQAARNNAILQQVHAVGLALFSYACDHDGKYPTGMSSTAVFQQLLDQGYVADPALFYVPMPEKVRPISKKLKPENVSFDVTAGVDLNSSDAVPILFLTGFSINYTPGSGAEPDSDDAKKRDGIVIYYKSNNAKFQPKAGDGTVPHVVPQDFDDKDHHYLQLTPSGPAGLA